MRNEAKTIQRGASGALTMTVHYVGGILKKVVDSECVERGSTSTYTKKSTCCSGQIGKIGATQNYIILCDSICHASIYGHVILDGPNSLIVLVSSPSAP